MDQVNDSARNACRRYARQIWREQPKLSIDEMLERHEIKDVACGGKYYNRNRLLDWILPDLTPHEELDFFRNLPLWKIEEATALWLDINPFILLQAVQKHNPAFWYQAFHPNLREQFHDLFENARRSAFSGQLMSKQTEDQLFVTPQDFYNWAMKNTEGPNGSRPQSFFSELQQNWSASPDPTKRETKVEEKIREIMRILDALTAADPEFDRRSMPGRKEDFQALCEQLNKKLFSVAAATFNDYLVGICSFNPGARKTDYYENICHKLG